MRTRIKLVTNWEGIDNPVWIGVDPSLTATGLVAVNVPADDQRMAVRWAATIRTSATNPVQKPKSGPDTREPVPLIERLEFIYHEVIGFLKEVERAVGYMSGVVIEDATDQRATGKTGRGPGSMTLLGAGVGAAMLACQSRKDQIYDGPVCVTPTEWLPSTGGNWNHKLKQDQVINLIRRQATGASGLTEHELMALGVVWYRTAKLKAQGWRK